MSSVEWARHMRTELLVPLPEPDIIQGVVDAMAARYEEAVPLLPGAVEAVRRLAARWPLGLASSANRPLIDIVLARAGIAGSFAATVSSEEVRRGKPSPDVYLEAGRLLGVPPSRGAAIEDSTNGLLAAIGAGMRTIAVPQPAFPPDPQVLARVDAVVADLDRLSLDVIDPADPP